MKKVVISLATLLFFVVYGFSFSVFAGEKSQHTSDIDSCIKKRKDWSAKSETKFVCPVGNFSLQDVVFQVVMSKEFKTLDDKMKKELDDIYAETNKDVGALAARIRPLFDETDNTESYPNKYKKICDSIVMKETSLYFTEKGTSVTTDNHAQSFVVWEKDCQALVNRKMKSYKEAAWLLGESAVVKSYKNDKHTYMRKLKDQYEKFLMKWEQYIGQLKVIDSKWTTISKKVQ